MSYEKEDLAPDAIDQNIADLMNAFEEAGPDIDKRSAAICRYTHVEVNLMLAQVVQELMDLASERQHEEDNEDYEGEDQ